MRIGTHELDERVLIVAEIGNNHEGDRGVARELVEAAAGAGADAVKFQTFRTDRFADPADPVRYERLSRFELPAAAFVELAELSRARGLLFFSTPLDLESADVLEPLVDAYKIASGDTTFVPLLDRVAGTGKPVIVSSGAGTMELVERAVERIRWVWANLPAPGRLAVLHCVSCYPVEPAEASLRAIPALAERLGCTVGYSDHTEGIEACPLAVAAGARILEKHFTLDKEYSDFRDHRLSADPAELLELVRRVREAEVLLGPPGKHIQPCERDAAVSIRRSIVAADDLAAGHVLEAADLMWLRPGDGLAPGSEDVLIGRALVRSLRLGEQITATDVRT